MTDAIYRACPEAIHVVAADGRVLRAGRAVLFIMAELGWPRLARLLGTAPLVWAVEWGYGLVARNRLFFARFLFTRE
jgi:hypothetical protein